MKTYMLLENTHGLELPAEFQHDDVRYPESLVKHFLREFTQEGDIVFDPFAGYGTTLLVAEEMGRIPFGIEFDAQRVKYARAQLKHPENLIHGDSRQLVSYNLPAFDFSISSPPYMGKYDRENPLTAYTTTGNGYTAYLRDIQSIYAQMKEMMKPGARAVVEVANLKLWDGLTMLAWDIAEAISQVLWFEGEIVVGWDTYGYGYDHSYCLVFTRAKDMDLQLAIASSCADTGCQVQFLDSDVCTDACYSKSVIEHHITVRPGDLVAVDRGADPQQVVFRWALTKLELVEDGQVFTGDVCDRSQPLTLAEGLEVNIAVGDEVFTAYGEIHDVSIGGCPANPNRLRIAFFPRIRAMYQRLETWRRSDPKQVVEEGYDRIAERHLEWARTVRSEERARYTCVLLDELPSGAEVLDLGCGAGIPTTQELARRFKVTGVDISERQLALARRNVPEARFIQADIARLDLPPASFDAVVAFYSIIHVPRQEQSRLLQGIASWLRPGGLLVATMGAHSMEADFAEDFLGAPMYWSSFDGETSRCLVEEAGLRIVSAKEETAEEFGDPVTFLWVIAQKPVSQDSE